MIALRPLRLDPGFVNVVTVLAQRLPVRLVPEQPHIPPVRYAVIDQRRNALAPTPL